MEGTKKNLEIVDAVLCLLAKENCTVLQATEILSFTQRQIQSKSTVQYRAGELIKLANGIN